jgi:glycosyltransferase involved in cell wall biosynthesis
LESLIRCFAAARARGSKSSLVLVGDGPLRHRLESQVLEAGLEPCVRFAGMKSTSELLPYYAFAHAFVLPSRREPWGLVVNEALAAGLPVIVSNRCGCASDLVAHGSNGFLFDADREEELVGFLGRVDRWSSKERAFAGRCSETLVSSYTPRNWAEEVLRLVRILSFAYSAAA